MCILSKKGPPGQAMTDITSGRQQRIAHRWSSLEEERDACIVVSRRMEVLYANAAARALVSPEWFACRCWEVFPVAEEGCAARCSAIRAVSKAEDIAYCEETLDARDGSRQSAGVAVIPLRLAGSDGEQGILLLRPRASGMDEESFRRELLKHAERMRALAR